MASQNVKVLHVTSAVSPRLGGPSKAAVEMCEALARRGVSVTLFTTNIDELGGWLPRRSPRVLNVRVNELKRAKGVELYHFGTRWPTRLKFSPSMARALRRRISEFDVVHIHSLYLFPTLAAAHYARRSGIPYLIRPHGTLDPFMRRRHRFRKAAYAWLFERRNLNNAAAIHFTSDGEMKLAASIGIRADAIVVPLGINAEAYAQLPPKDTFSGEHPELVGKQLV